MYLDIPCHQTRNLVTLLTAEGLRSEGTSIDSELLSQVPSKPWVSHSIDVRRLLAAEPVKIKCETNQAFLAVPQYPLSWEVKDGICLIILSLKEEGVLIPARSPCNTHISPVEKDVKFDEQGKQIWRFV